MEGDDVPTLLLRLVENYCIHRRTTSSDSHIELHKNPKTLTPQLPRGLCTGSGLTEREQRGDATASFLCDY